MDKNRRQIRLRRRHRSSLHNVHSIGWEVPRSIAVSYSGGFYNHPTAISLAGLPDRITKLSAVPALLVPTSIVHPFRSNVIDFDSHPGCWAGSAFDSVHSSVLRKGLDDIAADLDFDRVTESIAQKSGIM